MESLPLIDIQKVFSKKNPKLAHMFPGFAWHALEHLIHQEEINGVITRYAHCDPAGFIRGALSDMQISYTAHGFERIPEGGRYVFVSNHPLGGLDGLILMDVMASRFGNFRFVVNDVLMNLPVVQKVFVPVNKFGRQKSGYVTALDDLFASDAQVLFFPAGLCSRKIRGDISDLPWNKTFLTKAIQHQREVVPVYFSARNSALFYHLANIRKFLGIKMNIEMFLLPREMFRQKGRSLSLVFGDPIPWQQFDASRSVPDWVEFVRSRVYAMA
mgnify:FL=1|jgi:putative hemolysin